MPNLIMARPIFLVYLYKMKTFLAGLVLAVSCFVGGCSDTVSLDESNFKKEIAEGVVLVDFWAPWCGPCKMLGPVIDQLADEYVGKAKVAKIDIEADDATKKLAMEQGVSSIPALMVFKSGEKVEETVGAQGKSALAGMIDNTLA